MEEEVGIKVTRLRRRLSVEADDVKSPSTQSTPTKKRGGRLAAKPQLELIDENATETEKPKRTRKSLARDAEPEEKAVTPSRRSTRARSNTSIISDTPAEQEEKGTPARRSTRIKSNTSIVAETVPFADSPRAKRAARRTSQVGSDNETPITPARQTRRTRKDSTSSIDKQVEPAAGKLGTQIKEVITEEVETKIKETNAKATPNKESKESPPTRKSPRLNEKPGRKSSSLDDNDNKENEPHTEKESNNNEGLEVVDGAVVSSTINNDKILEATEESNLSVSSSNLIKDLNSEPKKSKTNLNKTTSAVDEPQPKSKRHRTKSWTTITSSPSHDNNFLSDTEAIKKKSKRKSNNVSGSGDSLLNTSHSVQEIKEQDDITEVSVNASTLSDKKKKKQFDKSVTLENNTPMEEISIMNTSSKLDKSTSEANKSSNKNDIDDVNLLQKDDPNFTEKFFGKPPNGPVQSLVYIEDSDSNTGSIDKVSVNKEPESEDQCVPVVEHHLNDENNKESKNNLSLEPMDIDETMPENVSLSVFTENNASGRQEEKRKSSLNISQVNNVSVSSTNKSLRKSIVLNQDNDNELNLNKSKRQSLTTTVNDNINDSMNKSKRKSSVSIVDTDNVDDDSNQAKNQSEFDKSINKSLSKSKRKSSITNTGNDDMDINSSSANVENEETENNSANKSKRKSSIGNVDQENSHEKLNKSKRKSSIHESNIVNNIDNNSSNANTDDDTKSINKSKRKSSISHVDIDNNADNKSINADDNKSTSNILKEDNVDSGINQSSNDDYDMNKSSNKSKRKSSITNTESNDSVLKDADKSKRKSISMITGDDEVDSSTNKSKRKSSVENIEDDIVNKSANKSKRKTSISNAESENNLDSSINKSNLKSIIDIINDTIVNGITDKSKRQSSISDNYPKLDKSTNKSKRQSSISQIESQSFDKSSNENKSTLVLSQIKDISETTAPKDIYEFNESIDSNEQLSKSANVPNIKDKETDKKNLSLTYSTSTPLQQKSMKKLGMQINTSIIAPNSATKTEKKNVLNGSKKQTSVLSQNDEESEPSDDDDEEDSEEDDEDVEEEEEDSEEENESMRKSKLIDDEAEEASDDYESGDSRDEDEKDYEAQNEIVEKGETLDSEEEDFSDDSDYERDSFIVDSEEEDNELLSGSGDDLSMSDNELSMSAKSKKKFNERKIKEQKKASREMFEARHKINESSKSSKSDKSKKGKRRELESSESESDEEVSVQPKKNRRARIDSSQDISQNQSDGDKSILPKQKKKAKRLSESVCEDETNEKEISIQKNNDIEKDDDPLSLQNVVKKEPKTPQKELNISTVAITNIEEVEEVQVDGNVSILKMNQTADPLQTTVAQDDAMEDDSDESISENEEITQNYESVLNDLNNKSKKIKSHDVSLNLGKKTKQKAKKEPIVDELNLTQLKKSKKKIARATENSDSEELDKDLKSLTKNIIEKVNKTVSVQDEGSSDSIDMKLLFNEDSTDGETNLATGKEKGTKEVVEDFIPLKRTEGKTNILESTDVTSSSKDDSILNVSKSKKNKRKSSQPEETATMNGEEDENVSFFIDTTGARTDEDTTEANTSVNNSAKKKKQKNNVSSANIEETKNDDDSNDAPLEVSYRSEKNKSKQDLNSTQTEAKVNTTISETPGQSAKKKKKNKKGLDNSQINVEDAGAADKSINTSILNVTGGNKKNKSLIESHVEQNIEETRAEPVHNVSIGSAKKQKKKTLSESSAVEKVTKEEIRVGSAHNISIGSAKKQKKKTLSESFAVEKVSEEETRAESTHNVSVGSAKKLKKKMVSENTADQPEIVAKDDTTHDTNKDNASKKRKRKPSANPSFDESTVKDEAKVLNTSKSLNESTLTNKKKKRKIAHKDEQDNPQAEDAIPQTHLKEENHVGKKAKKKNKTIEELKPTENSHDTVNKNKKRKMRPDDEDDGDKSSKVTKQNSTDKVYVPRLPPNILKQLEDKPKKDIDAKTRVTSTTSFMVEETKKRRAKPSNYLEQSVYLNDSIEETTKKSQLKKPKVLPFIPTASTSNYGFTTSFRVNIIPKETQFVAQSSDVSNFKKDCLEKNRIKKLGTFEMYKRHRNIKISKF